MKKFILNIIILAIAVLSATAQQNNKNVEIYFSALSEYYNNNAEKALNLLNLASENPKFIELKAKIHYENKNFSPAIKYYSKLADFNPSKAYYELAKIYAMMGYEMESMHYLGKHFEFENPKSNPEINLEPAFHVIINSVEWRKFWETNPYSENQKVFERAEYYMRDNKYSDAIGILENLRASGNDASQKNYLLSNAYFHEKNYSNALHYINQALRRDKNNITYIKQRLAIYIKTKRDAEALNDVNLLLKFDEYEPDYYKTKAKILNNLEEYSAANEVLNFYLDFFSADEDALYYSAVINSNMRQFADALKRYNQLIEVNPSNPNYFIERGDIYFNFESWNFAANDYAMALDINPRNGEAHYQLGWCRYKMNDREKACISWRHALRFRYREAPQTLMRYCRE